MDMGAKVQGGLDNLPDVSSEWRKSTPALFSSLSLSEPHRAQRYRGWLSRWA